MISSLPETFCETKARVSLNAQQWSDLAKSDQAKAKHSAKRAERFSRQLAMHLAACPACGGVA